MSKTPSDLTRSGGPMASRFPWRIFFFLAGVYLLSVSGRLAVVDQAIMFAQTRSLIAGKLSLSGMGLDHVTPEGRGGQHYSQYGLLMSLLWVPSTLAARAVGTVVSRFPLKMLEEFAASFINVAASLGILAYLVQEWRRRGVPESRVRWGLLGLGLSTLLWAYAKMPFSDLWMALGLFAAYCHWRRRDRSTTHAWLAGAWLGVALLSRKQAQMLVPLVGLAFVWEVRRGGWHDLLRVAGGFLPAVGLQALYNLGRFGNPLLERYPYADAMEPQSVGGVASHFISIFIDSQNGFVPFNLLVIALAVLGWTRWWRADPLEALLPWALLLASAAFLSQYWFWGGGLCFGSRYLLFLIPFFALGLAYLPPTTGWMRGGLVSLAAVGGVVQLAGILVDPLAVAWRARYVDSGPRVTTRLYAGEIRRVLGGGPPAVSPEGRGSAYVVHPVFQVPDFWWSHLIYEIRTRGAGRSSAPDLRSTEGASQ